MSDFTLRCIVEPGEFMYKVDTPYGVIDFEPTIEDIVRMKTYRVYANIRDELMGPGLLINHRRVSFHGHAELVGTKKDRHWTLGWSWGTGKAEPIRSWWESNPYAPEGRQYGVEETIRPLLIEVLAALDAEPEFEHAIKVAQIEHCIPYYERDVAAAEAKLAEERAKLAKVRAKLQKLLDSPPTKKPGASPLAVDTHPRGEHTSCHTS